MTSIGGRKIVLVGIILLLAVAVFFARAVPHQSIPAGRTTTPARAPTNSLIPTNLPITPTATEPPAPPTLTLAPPPVSTTAVLKLFPLAVGNTWTYTDTQYSASQADPLKTIQAIFEITRQVVEVKTAVGFTLVNIRQDVSKVSEDPGWGDQARGPTTPDSFWYILHDNKVYSTVDLPADLGAIDYTQLTLEYIFPMAKDAEWCPSPIGKPDSATGATAVPCSPIGKRVVLLEEPFQSSAGAFDRCYQLGDVYNDGGSYQTFCDGVGVVEEKFDHSGSLFGYHQTLTRFTPGTAATPLLPTATQPPQLTDEQALARAVMGSDRKTYCSWEILGYHAEGVYAWAYCSAQDAASPTVKSVPVVIRQTDSGHFRQVIVPGSGASFAGDVQNLFPPDVQQMIADIQQATSDFTVKALADGIRLRTSGQIHTPYTLPLWDPGGASCSYLDKATDHLTPASDAGLNGWQKVSVPETGFSFITPGDWTVIESWATCTKSPRMPHYLSLQPPDHSYQLTIGFRLPDQPIWLTRTGTPAGDFVDAGSLTFMGKSIPIQPLVYGKRVMAVFYNGAAEFPAGGILFTLSLDIISDPKNDQSIPVDVEVQAARILASFKLLPSP